MMRKEHGLEKLIQNYTGNITTPVLARLLMDDLKSCKCTIFGIIDNEIPIILAELKIIPDSLDYEQFDKRIEFIVTGKILNDQCVPLTYKVQGDKYSFSGRCSTILKICGVDLYLNSSYTGILGDTVQQKFNIPVKRSFKTLDI